MYKSLFISCIAVLVIIKTSESTESVKLLRTIFNVQPGGQTHTHKEKVKGFSCEFKYACQGGTNEEWIMEIIYEKENLYTCQVFRERESYLFFTNYKLMVGGGYLKDGFVVGEKNQALSPEVDYDLDKGNNEVSSTAAFQAPVRHVMAYFTKEKEKEEL